LDKSKGTAAWPMAKLTAGGETDLRISTAHAHSGVGDKLFAGPLATCGELGCPGTAKDRGSPFADQL
jgi:hypothetical protein